MKTPEERKQLAHEVFEKMESDITYLYCRWQDEKEYEDFGDYTKRIKKSVEEFGVKFIKATKRPFGFVYCLDEGINIQVAISGGYYNSKRV